LLGGGNGRQDGLTIDSGLDVGGSTLQKSAAFQNRTTDRSRHTYSSANIFAARET
jgi:hypothetical protein